MPTEVDAVVVGAGPAGAAAAHLLATCGRSVLVCERSLFPRDKACGDGLSPRAVRVLQRIGLSSELETWARVPGVRVHAGGRAREFAFPTGGPWPAIGLARRRRDLDEAVLRRARDAGAQVVHGAEVAGLLQEGDTVVGAVVRHEGRSEPVRAGWVICAEGAGGQLARSLGRTMRPGVPRTLAVRQYFPSPQSRSGWFEIFAGATRLHGRAVPGYGWVFPVGDGLVNAGAGLETSSAPWRGTNLHRLQRAFLETLPAEWGIRPETAATPPRAGRLPMAAGVWPPHGPGFLLVGDAAAMVNPTSGEGIAYALETGRTAARHVDDALRRGSSPSLEAYTEEIRATYLPYFRLGVGLGKIIRSRALAELVVAATMSSKPLFEFAVTVMAHLDEGDRGGARGLRLLESAAKLVS